MNLEQLGGGFHSKEWAAVTIQSAIRRHKVSRVRTICTSLKQAPLLSQVAKEKLIQMVLDGDLACSMGRKKSFFVPHLLDPEIGDRVWVRLDSKRKCTRIQRVGLNQLGSGSFKQVFASSSISVPWDINRPAFEEPTVAFRVACRYHCEEAQIGVEAVKAAMGGLVGDASLHLSGCWDGFDVEKARFSNDEKAFWAEGPRLYSLDRKAPAEQLLPIFRDAGQVLKTMHIHHVLHGDISWGNLMKDQSGEGWIIDLDWCGPIRTLPFDDRPRRDPLWANEGILTPMSDFYGLAYQVAVGIFGETFVPAVKHFGGHKGAGMADGKFLDAALPIGEDHKRNQLSMSLRRVFQDCQRLYEEIDPELLRQLRAGVWADECKWQQFEELLCDYPGIMGFLDELV